MILFIELKQRIRSFQRIFKTGKPGNRPAHNFYCLAKMFYYVYLLQSKSTKKFYVGFTSNLKRRLFQHNNGEVHSTKACSPYELVYFEGFKSKTDALIREKNSNIMARALDA